jgi:hypothetical protein
MKSKFSMRLFFVLAMYLPATLFFQNCKVDSNLGRIKNLDKVAAQTPGDTGPVSDGNTSAGGDATSPGVTPVKLPVITLSDGEPYGGKIQRYYALLSDFTCPDQSGVPQATALGQIKYENGQYTLETANCESKQMPVADSEVSFENKEGTIALIYKGRGFQYSETAPPLQDTKFFFTEVGCIETFDSIYRRKFGKNTIDLKSPDVVNGQLVRYDRYDFSIYSNYQGQKHSIVNLKSFSPEIIDSVGSVQSVPISWSETIYELFFRTLFLELNWYKTNFNMRVKFQPMADGTDVTLALLDFTSANGQKIGPLQGVCPIFNRDPNLN